MGSGKNWLPVLGLSLLLVACDKRMNFDRVPEQEVYGQEIVVNNKVDLLFLIDNSSSMQQHQQRLSDQIDSLMLSLEALKMDYHLGVITTSMGGSQKNGGELIGDPKVLTSFTPGVLDLIKSRFVVGQGGSNNERGLESLMEALSEDALKQKYPEFLRPEAQLVILVLSDEDDHSTLYSPADVARYLDSIKPPTPVFDKAWVLHFIGVTSLTGNCRTYNQYADPGLRYMDLASYSGGIMESICSADLKSALKGIETKIIQILTDFYLVKRPVLGTLKVFVNQVLVPENSENGWSYNEELNFIRFHGSFVPPSDAEIIIDFKPAVE